MKLSVKSSSLDTAFEIFKSEVIMECPDNIPSVMLYVNLDNHNINDEDIIQELEGKGILYGHTKMKVGDNANKVVVQLVNHPVEGEKKWDNIYMAVYDHPRGLITVPGSKSKIKKECIDIARLASETEKRHTFVIIGKSPKEFDRLETEIIYKPSPNMKLGEYVFLW